MAWSLPRINPIGRIMGDKVSNNMLQKKLYVCRFDSKHIFTNYEDYANHMTNVEQSSP